MSNKPFGFTLIEILLIVIILAILISFIIPFSLDFYKSQQLQIQTQGILQTLRRAQLKAMSVERDSLFGVYFTSNDYTLFKGDSYLSRDAQYDEIFDLPAIINLSGLPEIVFAKLEGKPNVVGDIVLSENSENRIINVNEAGRIGLQ